MRLDELIHNCRRSGAVPNQPAGQFTRLESRLLFSSSPIAPIAAELMDATATMTSGAEPESGNSGSDINAGSETGTISWEFDSNSESFDYLAAGESLTLTYTITMTDSQNATNTQNVTITISGTNDVPVISLEAGDSAGDTLAVTGGNLATDGTLTVTDLDRTDAVTAEITNFTKSDNLTGLTLSDAQLEALLSINANVVSDTQQSGKISWQFDSAGYTFGYLAAGESITLTYTIAVTDAQNATDTQDITTVINGDNSAPLISVEPGDSDADTLAESNTTLTTDGTLSVEDINTTDTVTAAVTNVSASGTTTGLLSNNAALLAMLSVNTNVIDGTSETGSMTWEFDSAGESFDYLASGEWLTLTYTISVIDSQNATDTRAVTITMTGTNDEQVLVQNTGRSVTEGSIGGVITQAMLETTDPDHAPDELVYTITSNVSHGTLRHNGVALGLSDTFTQQDINNGLITYDHDGSENHADSFSFSVNDGEGSSSTGTFDIAVTPVNDHALGITSNGGGATAGVNAAENTTFVTTVTATDADLPGDTLTFSISGGANAGHFVIDSTTGRLHFIAAPDFETPGDDDPDGVYAVTVAVFDGVHTTTQTIFVTVTDVNEFSVGPISDTNAAVDYILENSAIGTTAGIVAFANDPDGTDTVGYSLDDNAGGLFAIDATTGVVTVAGAIDRETVGASLDIVIRATSTDNSFTTRIFTIAIGDVDEFDVTTPTDADASPNQVDENVAIGTTVGITVITLHVAVTDAGGLMDTALVNVLLQDVNEPPSALFLISGIIPENSPAGTFVATVTGMDPDAGDVLTYSLIADADGRFVVDTVTGQIRVASIAGTQPGLSGTHHALNFEVSPQHRITVRVTDAGGLSYTQTYTIQRTDANDAPEAAGEQYSIQKRQRLEVAGSGVPTNDFDEDGQPLQAVLVTGTANGTLTFAADGTFQYQYQPTDRFVGVDRFSYYVTDGTAISEIAEVRIDVIQSVAPNPGGGNTPGVNEDVVVIISPPPERQQPTTPDTHSGDVPADASTDTESSSRFHRSGPEKSDAFTEEIDDQLPEQTIIRQFTERSADDSISQLFAMYFGIDQFPPEKPVSAMGFETNLRREHLSLFGTPLSLSLPADALIKSNFFQLVTSPKVVSAQSEVGLFGFNFAEKAVVGTTAVVSTSLSVGYVIRILRGGSLLTAVLSALPAWTSFDPLVILNHHDHRRTVEDTETLLSIATSSPSPAGQKVQPGLS